MKKKGLLICTVVVLLGLLVSCATTPIKQQYPDRWEKTTIGMSLDEFQQVWPEARYGGNGLDNTEIWTVIQTGFIAGQESEFFTFKDNKLLSFQGTGTN
jgi:hypothetical protein